MKAVKILVVVILLTLSSQAQDTIFRQKGKDLYITTRRGTALVRNQDLYERHYSYNAEETKRERKKLLILDGILLAAFFTVRALINKN